MRDHPFISPELISSYLPDSFGPDRTSRSLDLIDQVRTHIDQRLPLAFSYNGIDRVVIPASLYLQNAT